MKLSNFELLKLMIEVAAKEFGEGTFQRRALMLKTEQAIRDKGLWTKNDELPSGSRGKKSKGLEQIDYSFMPLEKIYNSLKHEGYDLWKVNGPIEKIRRDSVVIDKFVEGTRKQGIDYFYVRNSKIMNRRKALDDYTCQACGFILKVGKSYIIECHHKDLVALGERKTVIDDLISLCPTCHRIAHSNPDEPLSISQIREHRSQIQLKTV